MDADGTAKLAKDKLARDRTKESTDAPIRGSLLANISVD